MYIQFDCILSNMFRPIFRFTEINIVLWMDGPAGVAFGVDTDVIN